ncbi:uncharacterized protein V6R79_008544 [Siganus canaliculatus]
MAEKSPFKMPPPADSSVKQYRQKQILVAYMLLDPTTTKQEIHEEVKEIAPESVATLNRDTRLTRAMEKKNLLLQKNLEAANRRLHEQDLTDDDFLAVVEPMPQEDEEEKDDED